MRQGDPVSHREHTQDFILARNKSPTLILTRRKTGRRVIGQHKDRQHLVLRPDQVDHSLPRPRPRNPHDINALRQGGKRRNHALHQDTVPAIEPLPGIRRIREVNGQQYEHIALQ